MSQEALIDGLEREFPHLPPKTLEGGVRQKLSQRPSEDIPKVGAIVAEVVGLLPFRVNRNQANLIVDRAADVIEHGETGILVSKEGGLTDILSPATLPGLNTFDKIPAGASLYDLGVGEKMPGGREEYGVWLPSIGREYTSTRAAILAVLRGVLTYRGTNLQLYTDCNDPTVVEGYKKAMAGYLEKGDNLLLNIPGLPVSQDSIKKVLSSCDKWTDFRENPLLHGGNTLVESKAHNDVLIMDLSRFPTGSFKDPGSMLEAAAMIDTLQALNGPDGDKKVRSLIVTTGNMGLSQAEINYRTVFAPNGELQVAVNGEPGIVTAVYSSKPAESLVKRMSEIGADVVTGFNDFHQAFDEKGHGVLVDPIGHYNFWTGDTMLRTKASETFALRSILDAVRKRGRGDVEKVVDYLKSGNTGSDGRKILDDTAKNMTLLVPVGNAIMSSGMAIGFHNLKKMDIISEKPYFIGITPAKAVPLGEIQQYVAGYTDKPPQVPKEDVTLAPGVRCPMAVQGPDTLIFSDETVSISDPVALMTYASVLAENPNVSLASAFGYHYIQHARDRNPKGIIIPLFTGLKRGEGEPIEFQQQLF